MHIVYRTYRDDQTVTIYYDDTCQQFRTEKERHAFSAEKLLQMLNCWAKTHSRGESPAVGSMRITIPDACCIFTAPAVSTLSQMYRQRHDWQVDYPFVSSVFGTAHVRGEAP